MAVGFAIDGLTFNQRSTVRSRPGSPRNSRGCLNDPEIYNYALIETLHGSQQFANDMMSCRIAGENGAAFIREGVALFERTRPRRGPDRQWPRAGKIANRSLRSHRQCDDPLCARRAAASD